jgi:hypothetical protein
MRRSAARHRAARRPRAKVREPGVACKKASRGLGARVVRFVRLAHDSGDDRVTIRDVRENRGAIAARTARDV